MSETKKRRGGRPRVNSTPVTVRLPPYLLHALDRYIETMEEPRSRPETIRTLMLVDLSRRGFIKESDFDEPED